MSEQTTAWGAWGADVRDDPRALFRAMRESCPVHHVRLGDGHDAALVVGHAAARQALKDPRLSKDMLAALDADPDVVDEGLPGPAFARHMLGVDPPDHTRLRGLVAAAFAPSRIAALQPRIERLAEDLLDDLERSGPIVDLVAGFAAPFPFRVIGELLGVPVADQPMLYDAFRTLLRPWLGSPPASAVEASATIVGYLERLVDQHVATPADDLVGVLVRENLDGERLTRQELLSSLFQLIVAGHDTTTSLIGNGVVALLDHPDQLALLRLHPELVGDAVEEIIRFDAPVPHATFRVTSEPVVLGDVEIPAGRQVLVCIGSANRDPALRDDPDRLDIRRSTRGHLGFGHGIHFCLGAPLARLEGRVAFGALLRRFPQVALAVPRADLRWSHGDGLVLRGLAELPVRLAPAG
jgi:cytochrome P450